VIKTCGFSNDLLTMRDTKQIPLGQEINSPRPEDPPAAFRAAAMEAEVSADSPRTTDEVSVQSTDQSQSGTEEVVYRRDYPETNQVMATRIIINYSSYILVILMVQYVVTGSVFIEMHQQKSADASLVFLSYSILMVLRICLEVYYSAVNTINSLVHYKAIMDAIGNLVVYHAVYCYLIGFYTGSFLVLYLVLNICLQFFKTVLFMGPDQRLPSYTFNLLEAVTYLLICLKIEFPEAEFSWAVALILFTLIYYIFLYLSSAYTFFVVLLSVMYGFGVRNIREVARSTIYIFMGLWLVVLLVSSTYCLGYTGSRTLLEKGAFGVNRGGHFELPKEMLVGGILMIVLGVLGIAGIIAANLFFKTEMIRKASNSTGKEITLKNYHKAIILSLRNISGNFFKATNEPPVNAARNPGLDDCVVCQDKPSNFLLKPCNHCVLCEDCTKNYLEFQSKCPMCKIEIVRALRIRIDTASGGVLTDTAFKVRVY